MIWEGRQNFERKERDDIYQFNLYKRHGKLQEVKDKTAYNWTVKDRKKIMKKEVSDFLTLVWITYHTLLVISN